MNPICQRSWRRNDSWVFCLRPRGHLEKCFGIYGDKPDDQPYREQLPEEQARFDKACADERKAIAKKESKKATP
jgi:hypothetical protein